MLRIGIVIISFCVSSALALPVPEVAKAFIIPPDKAPEIAKPFKRSPPAAVVVEPPDPSYLMLPDSLDLYVQGYQVSHHPLPGYRRIILINDNTYNQHPGCYVACYSHEKVGSSHSVNTTTHVIGQIRIAGTYHGDTCMPAGYSGNDIASDLKFVHLCNREFIACATAKQGCWVNNKTGKWFNMNFSD